MCISSFICQQLPMCIGGSYVNNCISGLFITSPPTTKHVNSTDSMAHKWLMRTSEQHLPKKRKTLISSDQIDALPDTSCCSSACLSKFSYTDLLAITMPYAELNKHQQTQFIINTMSVTCISLVPSCHFSLRLNGTPVCLTTF